MLTEKKKDAIPTSERAEILAGNVGYSFSISECHGLLGFI